MFKSHLSRLRVYIIMTAAHKLWAAVKGSCHRLYLGQDTHKNEAKRRWST